MKKNDKKIAKKTAKWLKSPGGREQFKKNFTSAEELVKKLEEERQVDPKELQEEITI